MLTSLVWDWVQNPSVLQLVTPKILQDFYLNRLRTLGRAQGNFSILEDSDLLSQVEPEMNSAEKAFLLANLSPAGFTNSD